MRRLEYLEVSGADYEAAMDVLNSHLGGYVKDEDDLVSVTPVGADQNDSVRLLVIFWAD